MQLKQIIKKQLDNEYEVNLAAKPLKHDTNIEKNSSYLTSLCYILGIIMIIILIIKQFKAAQIPVATAVAIPRVRGVAV